MTEQQIYADYVKILEEEAATNEANIEETLAYLEKQVDRQAYEAIKEWIFDPENGIWGNLKFIEEPLGDYQEEFGDYWEVLKGMWVEQYCGMEGDDYSGFLTIQIDRNQDSALYLQASFNL